MTSGPSPSFLPSQPSAELRARQQRRFFGSEGDWPIAILTPIVSIYNAFPAGQPLETGWWMSKQWQNVLICATPQASAILDPLCALEPSTSVLFVGLAGALSTHSVGTVVEPSKVLLDGSTYPAGWDTPSRHLDAPAVTVRCLNEARERHFGLTGHAQVVDMEAGWVCAAAQQHGRRARVVLIVSDELHGRTFLDNELADLSGPITQMVGDIIDQITEANR